MPTTLFRQKRCNARLRRSWLGSAIEGCWSELHAGGYKRDLLVSYANTWLAFASADLVVQ